MRDDCGLAQVRSVLVLKMSSLGDIVHTLPAVARLKAARPTLRIAWMANTEWIPLLRENPDLDKIIDFPRREFRRLADTRKVYRWLSREVFGLRPDLALDFQGLLRTAVIGRLAGPGRLHGMSDAREGARFFFHRTVSMPGSDICPPHAVERYLALVDDLLGASIVNHSPRQQLHFRLPKGEPWIESLPPGGFILLHPFARGSGKSLSVQQIEAFCRRLAPRPIVIVGRTDGGMHAALRAENVCDLVNQTTLAQLIWFIRAAAFVISVDSGPMHIAAALTHQLIGIHGWSDPRRIGPYNPNAWVWKSGRVWRVGDLPADSRVPANAALLDERPTRLEVDLGEQDIAAICNSVMAHCGL